MRPLLSRWIDTGKMHPFHLTEKSRSMGRTIVLSKKVVPVFSVCRLLETRPHLYNVVHVKSGTTKSAAQLRVL